METRDSPENRDLNFNDLLLAVGQRQDKESFVQLFEHFAPRIKSFLIKGGLSPEAADELAQETMLTLWQKASNFDPSKAAASTWIFTIARNKKIDALRKSGRESPLQPEPFDLASDEPLPSDSVIQAQENETLAEALAQLPEEQAELLQKSFFEGKSHGQIAEETGTPLGTVKSRIRLALEKLRQQTEVEQLR